MRPVDLRSDTVTRPTPGMRAAMLAAEVGDDVLGDDPTVAALEARCAALSGKEAALFVPSGTMANQLAVVVQARPGDAVLVADNAHVLHHEGGGAAANAGAELRVVPSDRGRMTAEAVVAAIPSPDVHHPEAALLCVEDTNNAGGGVVHELERLDALCAAARAHGMRAHLDGARLFNAVVASGVPLARRARGFDTVAFCFSKGLGAPVGSILCGDAAAIHRARRARKRMGGGMRQAGFLAAAALYALDHHVERLADDHARARQLGVGLMVEGYEVQLPETNLVYVQVPAARRAQDFLAGRGVLAFAVGPERMRLCTHLDVDDAGVERAIAALAAWRRESGGGGAATAG